MITQGIAERFWGKVCKADDATRRLAYDARRGFGS